MSTQIKSIGIALMLFAFAFQLASAQTPYHSGTWTGVWQGQTVNLVTIHTNTSIENLPDAVVVGNLTNFYTDNPSYSCLNGETIPVWSAPNEYPGEYLAHNGGIGTQCAYFTAIISTAASTSGSTPAATPYSTGASSQSLLVTPAGFAAVGLTILVVYAAIIILAFVLFIWMLIDCIKRQEENKVVWILVIFFIGIIGPLIYYFVAKRPRDAKKKMGQPQQKAGQ